MRDAGTAVMGIGMGSGTNRASEAAQQAVSSPLLDATVEGATGILLNISGGTDIGLFEVNEAAELVTSAADQNANVIFGAVIDESLKGAVRVTVIATGFGAEGEHRRWRATRKGGERKRESAESFEVPEEVLEIPSFLRDD
jgi:cell division protein FtsZ